MTKCYIERHNEAGLLILKAIAKGTKSNNTFIADLGSKKWMQEMGALDRRLPPWLACESTIRELHNDESDPSPATNEHKSSLSYGIIAPEDRLKLRPDIMMVDILSDELEDVLDRQARKRKIDGKQAKRGSQAIGKQRITVIEVGYVADTRYDDKLNAKLEQHRRFIDLLKREGHEVNFYPIILGTQGFIFKCFERAMAALGVPKSNQLTLAKKLSTHAITTLAKIIKSRRYLEYQTLKTKIRKPPDRH